MTANKDFIFGLAKPQRSVYMDILEDQQQINQSSYDPYEENPIARKPVPRPQIKIPEIGAEEDQFSEIENARFEKKLRKLELRYDPEIRSAWWERFPQGEITTETEIQQGFLLRVEKTHKGEYISRAISPDGNVTAIEWKKNSGEIKSRSYYESGELKTVSRSKGINKIWLSTKNKEGMIVYKELRALDGSGVVVKYDSFGRPTEKAWVHPGGGYDRVWSIKTVAAASL